MKILIVEDHAFQRDALQMQLNLLSEFSITDIRSACSGVEAIDILHDFTPDVLFCDLSMPEMDGITFLSNIAAMSFSGAIVIISAADTSVINTVTKMCHNYNLTVLGAIVKPTRIDMLRKLLGASVTTQRIAKVGLISKNEPLILTESDIEQAFRSGWLKPYFQPLVSLKDATWQGCEALVRLVHPLWGIIPPLSFLPLLSAMGKDHELALLTVNYIINHQSAYCYRKVAVNITPNTLIADGFVNEILILAGKHHQLKDLIHFEITESDAFENTGRALEAASRLGMHGFKLSIDDFGTGYSSLKQLETLPFESLKLDMSFVQALPTSVTATAIIESCLLLTRRLNLTSVAEGVEDHNLWLQLQMLDCDLAQGYFIGAPMHVSELHTWHQNWQIKMPQLALKDSDSLV